MDSFVSNDEYVPKAYIQMFLNRMICNLLKWGFRVWIVNNKSKKTWKLTTFLFN